MPYASDPAVQKYLELKAQVEALRAQAKQQGEVEPYSAGEYAQSGGGYQVPDIYVPNWGGMITNALRSGEGQRSAEQLSRLEQEMAQARTDALRGAASGERSEQRALDLSELGAPEALVGAAMPAGPQSPTPILQALQQGLSAAELQAAGIDVTPEQAVQLDEARKARLAEKAAADAATRGNTLDDRKALELYKAGLKPKPPVGGPIELTAGQKQLNDRAINELETEMKGLEQSVASSYELTRMLEGEGGEELGGTRNTIAAGIQDSGLPFASTIAGKIETPLASRVRNLTTESVLSDMKRVGGNDSNEEMAKMERRYPSGRLTPEASRALARDKYKWDQVSLRARQLMADARRNHTYFEPDYEKNRPNYFLQAKQELGIEFEGPPAGEIPANKLATPEGGGASAGADLAAQAAAELARRRGAAK